MGQNRSLEAAFDQTFDVLICYRRTDLLFAEELCRRLTQSNDLRVFLDVHTHHNGYDWRKFWGKALERIPDPELDPNVGPTVVVLATHAMQEQKTEDVVVQEIGEALQVSRQTSRMIPINVLRLSKDGYGELQRRTIEQLAWDPSSRHSAPGLEGLPVEQSSHLSETDWSRICAAVTDKLLVLRLRILEGLRKEALDWADWARRHCLSEASFADAAPAVQTVRESIRTSGTAQGTDLVSLVGDGGFGKTIALAGLLKEFCGQSSRRFPIILRVAEVENAASVLLRKLRVETGRDVESLSGLGEIRKYGRLVFITDGLEHADSVRLAAQALNTLRQFGDLWITSRSSIWDEANQVFQIEESRVFRMTELDAEFAARTLHASRHDIVTRPYLQQSLYLDLAIYMSKVESESKGRPSLWISATVLLDAFREWALTVDDPALSADRVSGTARDLVKRLAQQQLEAKAFPVTRAVLLNPADERDTQVRKALDHLLVKRPFLVEDKRVTENGPIASFRLRHDVIDAHNVICVATEENRRAIIDGQDLAFGQIVSEVLAQTAIDQDLTSILQELFEAFVLACDNKAPRNLNSPWNARAWAGTFLVQRKHAAFMPWTLLMIGAEQLGYRKPRQDGERISTLGPPARVTREALSSIASGLLGARTLGIKDPGGAKLALLLQAMAKAERKARLVEAIPKFDDDGGGAVKALVALAKNAALLERDPGLMAYIAGGLRDLVKATIPDLDRTAAIDAGKQLLETARTRVDQERGIDRPVLRTVYECVREMAGRGERGVTSPMDWTDQEIQQGLALHATGRVTDLSDWRVFWYYADRLRREAGVLPGTDLRRNVLALGLGVWHDAIPCRVRALDALGACEHPMARGFLLDAVATQQNESVQDAALNGLGRHMRSSAPPVARAIGLALARTAAQRFEWAQTSGPDEVGELLRLGNLAQGLLFTPGAIELQRLNGHVVLRRAEAEVLNPIAARLIEINEPKDPGPDIERKIKLLPRSLGASSIAYAPTSWRAGRPFHEAAMTRTAAMQHRPRSDFHDEELESILEYDRVLARHVETTGIVHEALEKLLAGDSSLPGLGVIHALVVTADGFVVEARRSEKAHYHPGAWAPSFEEQIREEDLAAPDPIAATLLRGMNEEFGQTFDPSTVRIDAQSLIVEWPILNVGVAVVATVSKSWSKVRGETGDGELMAHRGIPMADRIRSLERDVCGGLHLPSGKWHPTAALRVGLLAAAVRDGIAVGTMPPA